MTKLATTHQPVSARVLTPITTAWSNCRLAARLALLRTDVIYRLWRLANREKSFADFYAWQVTRKLDRGRAHKTLGKRRIERDAVFAAAPEHDSTSFAARGSVEFAELLRQGLHPQHKVVEYGCGSLRVGQRCIALLPDRHYVGLDITERFFRDGRDMLKPELVAAKHPRFHVINDASLLEVSVWKPDFVFAAAVTQHVPPFELDTYIDRLCRLKHPHTRLVLFFVAAEREVRLKGKSWASAASQLTTRLEQCFPGVRMQVRARPITRTPTTDEYREEDLIAEYKSRLTSTNGFA